MGTAKKNHSLSFKEVFLFLRQYLLNPRKIGSIYPSSPALGRAMVSFLENREQCTVIELGPGTGSITHTLLESSIDIDHFYACELSAAFAKHLRQRFPGIHVREGDASQLSQVFEELVGKVDCIFSSLPLRSLPPQLVKKIIDQMHTVLKPQGIVIQFTYDLRQRNPVLSENFSHIGSKIVTANLPPARVNAFVKH